MYFAHKSNADSKKTFMKIIFITLEQPRTMKTYTHICMSELSYIIGHQIHEKLNISSPLGMECNNQWQPSNNHNDYLTKNISCHYPKMLGFEMILIFLFFLFLSKQDEDRMVHYTKRITVVREKIWRLRVREAMVLVDTEQFVLLGPILEDFR